MLTGGDYARVAGRGLAQAKALAAFIERRPATAGGLEVELRLGPPAPDPVPGSLPDVSGLAVLWDQEVPIAALVHDVVVVNQTAERTLRNRVQAAARRAGLTVESVREAKLWQLLSPIHAR